MTHLFRKTDLCALLFIVLMNSHAPDRMAQASPQHLLLRNLEPIFREDLIPAKNRTAAVGVYGPDQGISGFDVLGGGRGIGGGRITPHSHLVLFLGGSAANRQLKRLPPPTGFGRNYNLDETHPVYPFGYPFGGLPFLDSSYFLQPDHLHLR